MRIYEAPLQISIAQQTKLMYVLNLACTLLPFPRIINDVVKNMLFSN
jgi:hypothetical protein